MPYSTLHQSVNNAFGRNNTEENNAKLKETDMNNKTALEKKKISGENEINLANTNNAAAAQDKNIEQVKYLVENGYTVDGTKITDKSTDVTKNFDSITETLNEKVNKQKKTTTKNIAYIKKESNTAYKINPESSLDAKGLLTELENISNITDEERTQYMFAFGFSAKQIEEAGEALEKDKKK